MAKYKSGKVQELLDHTQEKEIVKWFKYSIVKCL